VTPIRSEIPLIIRKSSRYLSGLIKGTWTIWCIHDFLQAQNICLEFGKNGDDSLRRSLSIKAATLMNVISCNAKSDHCSSLLPLEYPAQEFRYALGYRPMAPFVERDPMAFSEIDCHLVLKLHCKPCVTDSQINFIIDSEGSIVEIG